MVELVTQYSQTVENARLELARGLEQKVKLMAESEFTFDVRFPYRRTASGEIGDIPILGDIKYNHAIHTDQVIAYHLVGQNLFEVFVAQRGEYGDHMYHKFGERQIPLDKMDLMRLDEVEPARSPIVYDILEQIAHALNEAEKSVSHKR